MKHKSAIKYFVLLLTLLIMLSGVTSCSNDDGIQRDLTNRDVTGFQNFSLNTESVGLETQVHGSIFVIGNSEETEDLRLRIVTWLEIDPDDFGGIVFYFPQGWEASEIVSDYPQGADNPDRYVARWQTADSNSEWRLQVSIGWSSFDSAAAGGGKGAFMLEVKPDSGVQELPQSIDILVGAGSKGEYTIHPCSQRISVALSDN